MTTGSNGRNWSTVSETRIKPSELRKERTCPKRCFLIEAARSNDDHHDDERDCPFNGDSHQTTTTASAAKLSSHFRLLGICVGLQSIEASMKYEHAEPMGGVLIIDDGTALVTVWCPSGMWHRMHRQAKIPLVGATLECLVETSSWPSPPLSDATWNRGAYSTAQQIAIIQDPNAEILRWLELSIPACTAEDPEQWLLSTWENLAGPGTARSSRPTMQDVYQIIRGESESSPGVALEDLVKFFCVDRSTVEGFIEELQMNGQVYRNQDGLYLPL